MRGSLDQDRGIAERIVPIESLELLDLSALRGVKAWMPFLDHSPDDQPIRLGVDSEEAPQLVILHVRIDLSSVRRDLPCGFDDADIAVEEPPGSSDDGGTDSRIARSEVTRCVCAASARLKL